MKIRMIILGLLIVFSPFKIKANLDSTVVKLAALSAAVGTFIAYKYDLAEAHVVSFSEYALSQKWIPYKLEKTTIAGSHRLGSFIGRIVNPDAQKETQITTQLYKVLVSCCVCAFTYWLLR